MERVSREEVEQLRAQVRMLSSQNSSLVQENTNLKEKLSSGTSEVVSKATFSMKAGLSMSEQLKKPYSSEQIMMGEVEVKMCADYLLDNEGTRLLHLWFELGSTTEHNAALLVTICYELPVGVCIEDEPVNFELLQLGSEYITRSTLIPARHMKDAEGAQIGLNVHVKLVRTIREDIITFAGGDRNAKVLINGETILVNVPYLSAWSDFFRHYFASKINVDVDEVYPIEECTAAEFRELLCVIYPQCKPISQWNVKSLIELADNFIMPSLSLKCVEFLTDRTKHNFSDAELLKMGDKYDLPFLQTIILECTSADTLQKNVISKDEYQWYSEELKNAIDSRFVESILPEIHE